MSRHYIKVANVAFSQLPPDLDYIQNMVERDANFPVTLEKGYDDHSMVAQASELQERLKAIRP